MKELEAKPTKPATATTTGSSEVADASHPPTIPSRWLLPICTQAQEQKMQDSCRDGPSYNFLFRPTTNRRSESKKVSGEAKSSNNNKNYVCPFVPAICAGLLRMYVQQLIEALVASQLKNERSILSGSLHDFVDKSCSKTSNTPKLFFFFSKRDKKRKATGVSSWFSSTNGFVRL